MINECSKDSVIGTYLDNLALEEPSLREIHKFHQRSKGLLSESLNKSRKALAVKIKDLKRRTKLKAYSIGTRNAVLDTITLLKQAESIYTEALQRAKLDCANLAVSLAEQIIGGTIKLHPGGLAQNIATAISQLTDQRGLKISVNPEQLKDLQIELKKLGLNYVELSSNSDLSIGDSVIESISGTLELNWRSRLEELKARVISTLIRKS